MTEILCDRCREIKIKVTDDLMEQINEHPENQTICHVCIKELLQSHFDNVE